MGYNMNCVIVSGMLFQDAAVMPNGNIRFSLGQPVSARKDKNDPSQGYKARFRYFTCFANPKSSQLKTADKLNKGARLTVQGVLDTYTRSKDHSTVTFIQVYSVIFNEAPQNFQVIPKQTVDIDFNTAGNESKNAWDEMTKENAEEDVFPFGGETPPDDGDNFPF